MEKNLSAAREAFFQASALDHPTASVTLAEMLYKGEGGVYDFAYASTLLKHVCEKGQVGKTMNQALQSFISGNMTQAIYLYTPLAAVGYEVALLNLAFIYKVESVLLSYTHPLIGYAE